MAFNVIICLKAMQPIKITPPSVKIIRATNKNNTYEYNTVW